MYNDADFNLEVKYLKKRFGDVRLADNATHPVAYILKTKLSKKLKAKQEVI